MNREQTALPLAAFSASQRAEIERLASADMPPARRILFHDDNGLPYLEMPSRAFYEWHWRRGMDTDAMREKMSPSLRQTVVDRHGMTCSICGQAIASRTDLHIDHVRPVSRGGKNDLANLRPAHARCNIQKSNKWTSQ